MGVCHLSVKKSLKFSSVEAGTTQQEHILLALVLRSSLDMRRWFQQETGSTPWQSIHLTPDRCSYVLV